MLNIVVIREIIPSELSIHLMRISWRLSFIDHVNVYSAYFLNFSQAYCVDDLARENGWIQLSQECLDK